MNDKDTNKKMGRPVGYRAKNPKNITLPVKVSEDELATYKAASKRESKTFSAWVREVLSKASKRE